MKKISKQKMAKYEGGIKCIYHGISAPFSWLGVFLSPGSILTHSPNFVALYQCLKGTHNE